MKNQCGKIGIDCEWCDNKVKCLTKNFYRDVINKNDELNSIINLTAHEIYNEFSNKIKSRKDFTICKFNDNDCICIDITRKRISNVCRITSDKKLEQICISDSVFDKVKELLNQEFDFSQVYFRHKYYKCDITNSVKTFLYFIP